MADLDEFAADDSVAAASARLETERKGHAATRRELARTQERVDELERLLDRYQVIQQAHMKVRRWMASKLTAKAHRSTALLQLSDLH